MAATSIKIAGRNQGLVIDIFFRPTRRIAAHSEGFICIHPGYLTSLDTDAENNHSVADQCERELTIDPFDLLEYQQRARETCCPKKLFALWEDICQRYEQRQIGQYELDEMKEVIWPGLKALASLRRIINGQPDRAQRARRRQS